MHKGQTVKDPFRRGLGQAVQWYNVLQAEVERQVNGLIQQSQLLVKPTIEPLLAPSPPLPPTLQQDSLS